VKHFVTCLIFLFALASGSSAAENLALRGVQPTPLFPKAADGARLEQRIDLSLENTGPAAAAVMQITLEGSSPVRQEIGEVPPGKSVKSARVPDRAAQVSATFELIDLNDGRVRGAQTLTLQPPRKWTIYHVSYSHEDLGYAACSHILRDKIKHENLRRAVQFCGETNE
jgi:hypothetical protein